MWKISLILLALTLSACSPTKVGTWWKNVQEKSRRLLDAELRYSELEKAHEELKREHYTLEHRYLSLVSEHETLSKADENLKHTGSIDGRAPADIEYSVPEEMDFEARSTLAYQHLKEQRYAEAAKTFDSFLWQPEGATMQNAKNFYEAGVAWFQVHNYARAKQCFESSLKHAESSERPEFERRVDLWLRILDQRRPATAIVKGKKGRSLE